MKQFVELQSAEERMFFALRAKAQTVSATLLTDAPFPAFHADSTELV